MVGPAAPPEDNRDPGKGQVTIKDIARELGVSVATVSRALSNDPNIARRTRTRVLGKASEMGYSPNLFARGLITRRSRIAALFAANITNPFYPEVVVKLTHRLQEIGLHTMLFTSDDETRIDKGLPLLQQYSPDIAIVLAATLSTEVAQSYIKGKTPVILFNRYVPGTSSSAVCCDNVSGGRLVAKKLIEAGHRRLAFIAGLEHTSTNIDRLRGFRQGCAEAGIDAPQIISGGKFTYETGYAAMKQLFDGPIKPEAVFCANDIVAIGAMDAAQCELGLAIPDDVSVIGFDDIVMASWPSHELTTVRQPVNAMIDLVISEVGRLLPGVQTEPREYFIPGRLIIRKSARIVEGKP
jgi:DNA-binding LacI/PurR family transcriptional regulator